MTGIILASHGGLAEGVKQSAGMVFGPQEDLVAVTLLPEDGPDSFRAKLEAAVNTLSNKEEVLFLVDLLGGTPFNQSVLLSTKLSQECRVFTGTNLPFLLTILFDREDSLAECVARWQEAEYKVTMFANKKKAHGAQGGGI